jgi:hypothetical protein
MSLTCDSWLCFAPIDGSGSQIFGFSEFLASLALMVIAWTIAEARYRFRLQTSSLPLLGGSFGAIAVIGVLTLLSDLWRAERWPVPQGALLTPTIWQAILGLSFLTVFLVWVWVATIRPAKFGKRNAKRFAQAVYQLILRGTVSGLEVLADELGRSSKALIQLARLRNEKQLLPAAPQKAYRYTTADYAFDILQLLADRRFCQALVESAPNTALALFREVASSKRYEVLPRAFSHNFFSAAMSYKNSFLYHETSGWNAGFLGHFQPMLQAIYSDFALINANPALLEPDYFDALGWTASQWEAYKRVALLALDGYFAAGQPSGSYAIAIPFETFSRGLNETYKLNGATSFDWNDGPYARLRISCAFATDALKAVNQVTVPEADKSTRFDPYAEKALYDTLAAYCADLIQAASTVRSPIDQCWMIQHNTVWAALFTFDSGGAGSHLVKRKLFRKLYAEVTELATFPNFRSSRLLGYCLNVMGLELRKNGYGREYRAFHRLILRWTVLNYSSLHKINPKVAVDCLVESISYDEIHNRLVKTYPADGLRLSPTYIYLDLKG